jgi:tektin-4
LQCITGSADQNQNTSTAKLAERAHEILKWKNEVERALEAMTEEIRLLEEQQYRASNSKSVLGIARSISSECIARRAQREGHELARDNVEEELIKVADI